MADRALTAGMAAALVGMRPIIFYEGEFTGGTLRLNSRLSSVSWNAQTWIGAGLLLGISKITETLEVRAAGFTVTLSHASSPVLAAALAQARQGHAGRVWIGALDAAGAVIADPYLAFEGKLDVPEISLAGDSGRITISYESRLIDLERPRERRITHEDQQQDYPGDRGREYIASLQDKVIVW